LTAIPLGPLIAIGGWAKAQWDVRAMQRAVAAREAAVAEIERRFELLARFDDEITSSQTKGIELAAPELATGHWRTRDSLDVLVKIEVRNTWVYPIVLDRLTGTFLVDTVETLDMPMFGERVTINPRSVHPVTRTIPWLLHTGYGDMLGAGQGVSLKTTIVRPTVYCRDRHGDEFSVTQQIQGKLLIDQRPTAAS
jgi:hypothetical protein